MQQHGSHFEQFHAILPAYLELDSRVAWLFDSQAGLSNRLLPRWIFLRALAAIYFSAFFSLLFQIDGLIGPQGILPAQRFLSAVQGAMGLLRFWYAPTLFWISSGSQMMMAVTWLMLVWLIEPSLLETLIT